MRIHQDICRVAVRANRDRDGRELFTTKYGDSKITLTAALPAQGSTRVILEGRLNQNEWGVTYETVWIDSEVGIFGNVLWDTDCSVSRNNNFPGERYAGAYPPF